ALNLLGLNSLPREMPSCLPITSGKSGQSVYQFPRLPIVEARYARKKESIPKNILLGFQAMIKDVLKINESLHLSRSLGRSILMPATPVANHLRSSMRIALDECGAGEV